MENQSEVRIATGRTGRGEDVDCEGERDHRGVENQDATGGDAEGLGTVRVSLSKGYYALIDAEDWERVKEYNWHVMETWGMVYAAHCGYNRETRKGFNLLMHRIIMDAPKGILVDHKNRYGLDNRKCNLRLCTTSQNQMNQVRKGGYRKNRKKSSRFMGVCWDNARKKWMAYICPGRHKYLGHFDNEEEAARIRDEAAKKLYKEFARLNLPPTGPAQSTTEAQAEGKAKR